MLANEAVWSTQAAERVVAVRVVAGRDQDQIGPVLPRGRQHDVLDQRAERRLASALRNGQVDRVALPGPRADVVERPAARPERVLVDAHEEHVAGVVEDRVGAVAVVHVPVEHQHPLGTQRVERVPRRDRNVREQAEADRPRPLGVVPGRAKRREPGALAAGEQRLRRVRTPRPRPAARPRSCPGWWACPGRTPRLGRSCRARARCTPPDAPAAAAPRWPRAPRVAPTRATRGSRAPPRSRGSCRAAPDGRGRCRGPARPGGGRTAACAPVRYLRAVNEPLRTDVAVVGAGAAGLYAALVAADQGASVALVSRSPLAQTASYWAQGGIAAALAAGRLTRPTRRGHARRRP